LSQKKNQLTVFVLPLSALFFSGNIHVYVKKERRLSVQETVMKNTDDICNHVI
jgi:hypothetical protein